MAQTGPGNPACHRTPATGIGAAGRNSTEEAQGEAEVVYPAVLLLLSGGGCSPSLLFILVLRIEVSLESAKSLGGTSATIN